MSPFKEPQPRKQPTDTANGWAEPIKKSVASMMAPEPWSEEKVEQVKQESFWTDFEVKQQLTYARAEGHTEGKAEADKDFQRSLDASRADLEVRAIALEWSVRYWGERDGRQSDNVVFVADKFEKYLREGQP